MAYTFAIISNTKHFLSQDIHKCEKNTINALKKMRYVKIGKPVEDPNLVVLFLRDYTKQ